MDTLKGLAKGQALKVGEKASEEALKNPETRQKIVDHVKKGPRQGLEAREDAVEDAVEVMSRHTGAFVYTGSSGKKHADGRAHRAKNVQEGGLRDPVVPRETEPQGEIPPGLHRRVEGVAATAQAVVA